MKPRQWVRWYKPNTGMRRVYVGPGPRIWLDLEVYCYGLDLTLFERWRIGIAVDDYGRKD